MDTNQIWKTVLIVLVVALAAFNLYPPQETLKPGIDLAGGTSLVYEIDTTDLKPEEQKDLAQNMIPILLKRIDPTHVANIVMRPQGNTRIEIQLPVASMDTRSKRDTYENALDVLEAENINLLKIQRSLSLPTEERQVLFADFANGNEDRMQILTDLADIYNQRTQTQQQRDTFIAAMEGTRNKIEEIGLSFDSLEYQISDWSKQKPKELTKTLNTYVKDNLNGEDSVQDTLTEKQQAAVTLIHDYIKTYNQWVPVVEQLTEPQDGLNVRWNDAVSKLKDLNLNTEMVRDILQLPSESAARQERLASMKEQFPQRVDKIEAVVAAYDEYNVVGGRLDDPEDLKRMLKGSGVLEFRILPTTEDNNANQLFSFVEVLAEKGPKLGAPSGYLWMQVEDSENWPAGLGITGTFGEKLYVLSSNQSGETMLHDADKKWKLKNARPDQDEQGRRAIGFTFDEIAANRFYSLTSANIGKPLCILLDDQAISAPSINSAIRSRGVITGSFTQTEVSDMVNKLNAGSFPARLSEVPISEKTISATIGADNRDQGIKAGLIGMAAVAVFMLLYYLLSGAIADIALVLNILLVLGIMAMLRATFTLPGIAGLILTIGMSVDANVLIFERIREEQKRGSSLKAAITNGYGRAFRTIFDANLTTFAVAAILYMAASEEIKGFAIVLMLGIVSSMFTALFVTRVIFEWLITARIITTKLAMFGVMQNINVNWMGLRKVFFVCSTAMIVGGLSIFFTRNDAENSKYDIEFIGGTSVEIELKEESGYGLEWVRETVNNNPVLTGAKVYEVGNTGHQFEISTTETNKSTATVTFSSGENSVESVSKTILESTNKSGNSLPNLLVENIGDNQFTISTSRVNASLVENALTEAFAETAAVSNVEVQEVVSNAVREAFKDYLAIRENLVLTITDTSKIDADSDEAALLGDYLGGIKLTGELKREITLKDLDARLRDLQFKSDMQDLDWYTYKIFKADLTEPQEDEKLSSFVYVSAHPEAGYRDLDQNEWDNFVANEKRKVSEAAGLETSLSRVTQIDPSIGKQFRNGAYAAILISLIAIVGYIWVRFGTPRYGFAAIAALVHDVCITLGIVTACAYIFDTPIGKALLIGDFKINLEMVAAFLTIIGYSLNDTIVVFDRIRENRGKLTVLTPDMISTSINQTLSRTLLTSFTTFLVVLVMYIWGGAGLRGFTFAMLIGIIVGTYSSIAIAAPILLLGQNKKSKK